MERLLTLPQVSELLGSKDFENNRIVKSLVRSGELNAARIGKKLMFRESDIEEFINRKFGEKK